MGAICLEHHALFDFVIDRVECSGGMRLPGQLRRCILRTYTWVSSFSRSTALSSLKLIVVAPLALAIESRSVTLSIAMSCLAPSRTALRIVIDRQDRSPDSHRVSWLDAALDGVLAARGKDVP